MTCDIAVLETRSRLLQSTRKFFIDRGFIEVETPVRIPTPALELHIDAEASGDRYLRTSPELHMKRLLTENCRRIFQIGPCFRRGELGQFHNPEYTMLEWYRTDADYMDILVDAKTLLAAALTEVMGSTGFAYQDNEIEAMPVWECLSVRELFLEFAGWDPMTGFDQDRFDMDFAMKIEPRLPRNRPVIIKDYPVEAAALARCRPGNPPFAERWELFLGGIELANAFTELTDPVEQRNRFQACAEARKAMGREAYALDEPFLSALERGMPPCAGAALGIDRLLMLMTNAQTIHEVRPFSG